jgi:hypothetical protein
MTLPVRITVRVDFDDGSEHEYEVRSPDAVPAPGGFWPEAVVTPDVAQRIEYARKRADEIERLRGERGWARKLVEEALHLRQNEERAPGGKENWPGWQRKAEEFLRSQLDAAAGERMPG